MNNEKQIHISHEIDVARATAEARIFAEEVGFNRTTQYMIATAVSELARNIFRYALKGEIIIRKIDEKNKKGVEVVAEDNGPGIKDIEQAMQDHFSTGEGLGLGLPGVKRLMDEFIIDKDRPGGTKVTVRTIPLT